MKKTYYSDLDETLFHETLKNGLNVYIITKKGYKEKCAFFGTRFGSLQTNDLLIDEEGNKHKVLGGIAHFLEHRLFDNKRGNVMDLYDDMGAHCNAYTSFDKTVYHFSTVGNFEQGLELLLDFPSEFEMSEEAVEKEKDIIIQEIKMYQDMPDRLLFFNALQSLYLSHPIINDIGGEIEEVQQTTRKLLNLCHSTFYDPSNMSIVIVGDVDVDQIMQLIKQNQKGKKFNVSKIERKIINEASKVNKEKEIIVMPVNNDKIIIGYKLQPLNDLDVFQKNKTMIALEIIGDILFSKSGEYYEKLVEQELVSSIDTEIMIFDGMASFLVAAESNKTSLLEVEIKKNILSVITLLTKENLDRNKKALVSKLLYQFNSCENIGLNFISSILEGFNHFDKQKAIQEIDLDYIKSIASEMLIDSPTSVVIIRSGEND